ncbi:MAG TPA: cobalamin-dependent protein [Nocardioidaceae bacterium]|nr:cobalamin-dependent protein [Nocardioidaceae bacterium]
MSGVAWTEYFDAVAAGDRTRALEVVRRYQDAGASPMQIMSEVIALAQTRVGELWAADTWSVAQEHAATAVSESVLSVLGSQIPPPADPACPVIVTCVEQEWHALPALMVAEHLRSAGIPVSYLGANASAEHLVRHVHDVEARAVALSCSLSASLPRVRRHIEAVTATGTPVLVGGAAFDPAGRRASVLGATSYTLSGELAPDAVRGLPAAVTPAAPLTHEGADEGFAVHAEREAITMRLHDRVKASRTTYDLRDLISGWQHALADHLPHLVGALAGALVAGDRTVLAQSVTWLDDVMGHRDGPDGITRSVVAELQTLMSEHPVASRMLSGVLGTARA